MSASAAVEAVPAGSTMQVDTTTTTPCSDPLPRRHTSSSSSSSSAMQFAVGDRVRVFADPHGAMAAADSTTTSTFWNGIIRKLSSEAALVHPRGPKSSSQWDVWVPLSRLGKQQQQHTAASRQAAMDKENANDSKPKAKRKQSSEYNDIGGCGGESGPNETSSHKRHKPQSQHSTAAAVPPSHYFTEQDLTLTLPWTLQTVLVEEYEAIVQSNLLHELPAAVPMEKVLDHFASKQPAATEEHDSFQATATTSANKSGVTIASRKMMRIEFCHQLRQLFQQALPVCLLYPQERRQYERLLVATGATTASHGHKSSSDEKEPQPQSLVQVYGCEYLLRLLLRLPLLGYHQSSAAGSNSAQFVSELVLLLQKNRQACFGKNQYRHVLPDE